jgi:hypothetical protein
MRKDENQPLGWFSSFMRLHRGRGWQRSTFRGLGIDFIMVQNKNGWEKQAKNSAKLFVVSVQKQHFPLTP